jgi:hypothetical protein
MTFPQKELPFTLAVRTGKSMGKLTAYKANTGYARSCNIKACSSTTASAGSRSKKLSLELREFGLELTQMEGLERDHE